MQKEINKYLKLINSEKLRKNYRQCIELYNVVGGLYTEVGSYDEAFHYHEEAYKLCKTIGDRSLTAVTFRYMGEAKAALGYFYQAIDYIKRYLELAENLNNRVEIQRAWTTLGRVYLMQAQESRDKNPQVDDRTKDIAREAEKRFQTALTLAESVRDQVDDKEYAQMVSGLLVNLGLIKDLCGSFQEAVIKFNRAIETCKSARIKEDLFRTQIILASIYRQRNDIKGAVKLSEEALQTAKSIGKKLLICDALIERGLTRLCQRDFKNAKRTFAQAYLEKSPNEEDHLKAIKLTKLSHLILENYQRICKSETAGEQRLKSCDKLGDLFVAIGNYRLAIEFYRRAYSDAKVLQKPKLELARILFSIAETYADDGQFYQAMLCYEKELSLRDGNLKEQCQSLIKIAHMIEYLDKEPEKVSEAYERAYEKAGKDPKLMHQVLKYYVPYLKQKSFNPKRFKDLEEVLLNLKSYPEVVDEIEREDHEDDQVEADLEDEVTNIDDIITDDEDNDEVLMLGRRRNHGANKFKQNEVGDTPLHEASIKGDLKRVKSLISQGHEINPRDHAGWIPLHEACNHGHYEIAEYLIEHGADVNNRGLKGVSPLHDAATNGHYEIMRLLMKNGANVIALTDGGETVLGCLRDYKKRNSGSFSNRDACEYKQMEAELLNIMDKSGFNLMGGTTQNSTSTTRTERASISGTSRPPIRQESGSISRSKVPPETSRASWTKADRSGGDSRYQVDAGEVSAHENDEASVKDYRDVIQTLKRKRNSHREPSGPVHKKSQPAVLVGASGSISTKQWLAQDDFEEFECAEEDEPEEVVVCRRKPRSERINRMLIDEEDDDIVVVDEKDGKDPDRSSRSRDSLFSAHRQPLKTPSPIGSPLPGLDDSLLFSQTPEEPNKKQQDQNRPTSASDSHQPLDPVKSALNILENPLNVHIGGRLLLVPIKDEWTTIKELKSSIVDRYSIMERAKPIIRLYPANNPSCTLFDQDLCKDVVREQDIEAEIVSWNLDPIESTYVRECCRLKLSPLTHIKIELRALDEELRSNLNEAKIDWSHVRLPTLHMEAILNALSHRQFNCANFQGSTQLIDSPMVAQELFLKACILSWKNLTRLDLSCTGLMRHQFEILCGKCESIDGGELLSRSRSRGGGRTINSLEEGESGGELLGLAGNRQPQRRPQLQAQTEEQTEAQAQTQAERGGKTAGAQVKLPSLTLLDVSANLIAYKREEEFVEQLKRLGQVVCPKLKRLDASGNHLQFVKNADMTLERGQRRGNLVCDSKSDELRLTLWPDIEIVVGDQWRHTVHLGSDGD